jgi:hypothetical protein
VKNPPDRVATREIELDEPAQVCRLTSLLLHDRIERSIRRPAARSVMGQTRSPIFVHFGPTRGRMILQMHAIRGAIIEQLLRPM